MEIFIILTLIFVFFFSICATFLIVKHIKLIGECNSIKNYVDFAKNKINSARYGNFQTKLDTKNDTFGLYKSLNDLFESVCDRDLVINEYREKEKENSNLKEEFIAALTHDLKVPIIAQNKTFDLLLEGKFGEISPCQREVILKLKDSGGDLNEMVKSILETYKIENTGIQLNVEHDIDVGEFLNECLAGVENLINSTGKKIEFHNGAPGLHADFDRMLIKRAANNLIINALCHSKTTDKIDIYLGRGDDRFSIDVVDYGEGIDEFEIQKIFNKYYSVTNKTTGISSGLGLYLSNKIVKKHNGNIEAESKKGQGAIFRINLPLKSE